MRLSVLARGLAVVAASASLIAVPMALPSAAATGATCKKASQTTKGSAITFSVSQCTPLAATGGSGKGPVTGTKPGQTKGTLNVKITWAQKKGTTSAKIKFAPNAAGLGKCPIGTTSRLKITGSLNGVLGRGISASAHSRLSVTLYKKRSAAAMVERLPGASFRSVVRCT